VTAYLLNIDGAIPSSSFDTSGAGLPVETNSDREVHASISGLSEVNSSPSSSSTAGTSLAEDTIFFPDEGFLQAADLTQEVQLCSGSHPLLVCEVVRFYLAYFRQISTLS
jgi:hypothetical protein